MSKNKKIFIFLIIMSIMVAIMPLKIVNAGITDVDAGATTNSKTTLEKKETGTEEVAYDTNLEEYIANKKNTWINSLTSEPEYKDEWLSLYVSSNGIYKYPVALHTYFTGVTTSNSDVILVGDPNDLINSGSNSATYNYRLEYKEITVTKTENPYEIKNVDITLTAPTARDIVLPQGWTGDDTENIVDDGTMEPDINPTVTTSTDHVMIDGAYWITGAYNEGTENWDDLFFGTFKKDTYYYADINILAETGYTFGEGLTIKVNGQTPVEVFGIYDGNSTHCIAKIKATAEEETIPEAKQKIYTINSNTKSGDSISFTALEGDIYSFYIKDRKDTTDEELQEIVNLLDDPEYTFEILKEQLNKLIAYGENAARDKGTLLKLYEMYLHNNGVEIHKLDGGFKLKIKITDDMKGYDSYKLIYIAEDGTTEKAIELTKNGEYLEGTLIHLSMYALVGSKNEAPTTNTNTTVEDTAITTETSTTTAEDTTNTTEKSTTTSNNPKTGDNIITVFSIFVISMLGAFITIKLNRNHKVRKH